MVMTLPNIYIAYDMLDTTGWYGIALAEDGTVLSWHFSSNATFSKQDMGVTSDKKHDIYAEHYPKGYNVVWLGAGFRTDERFIAASKLNHQLGMEANNDSA